MDLIGVRVAQEDMQIAAVLLPGVVGPLGQLLGLRPVAGLGLDLGPGEHIGELPGEAVEVVGVKEGGGEDRRQDGDGYP